MIGGLEYKKPILENRFWNNRFWKKSVWGKYIFARTDFGRIDLAKNILVGFDNFFTEENVAKEMMNLADELWMFA